MKNLFTYILVILLGLPMISKLTVMVQWKLNQQAITNTLCVNVGKPEVMCHGKCVLNERLLNVDENKDIPLSKILKDFNFQPFICEELSNLNGNELIPDASAKNFQYYQKNYSRYHHNTIFTPPDVTLVC